MLVSKLTIINEAEPSTMIANDETDALEHTQMKYRYLDLKRPDKQANIVLRSNLAASIRNYLHALDFVDIDIPEGTQDILVSSRPDAGASEALPQSPTFYKQQLMMSGFERNYQITKCFREDDLHFDNEIEFSHVDMDMAFMSELQIQEFTETMVATVFKEVLNIDIPTPFERLTWIEAMNMYGSDKPDTRFEMTFHDLKTILKETEFNVLKSGLHEGGTIKAIVVKNHADISRKGIDKVLEIIKSHGGHGVLDLKFIEVLSQVASRNFLVMLR